MGKIKTPITFKRVAALIKVLASSRHDKYLKDTWKFLLEQVRVIIPCYKSNFKGFQRKSEPFFCALTATKRSNRVDMRGGAGQPTPCAHKSE